MSCRLYELKYLKVWFSVWYSALWPPLWSSGQSSCLQIQRSGFNSRRHQCFWEIVGLERGLLSLVCIGAPIIFGLCPSLLAHESESMLRTYLVCREKQERERETSKRHVGEAHSVLTTVILLSKGLNCYWGKIVSLRMFTNLRLVDLRLTTAQQRSTGQNLLSHLFSPEY
jgi:hypothetical protein